jgi:hypothetical protein
MLSIKISILGFPTGAINHYSYCVVVVLSTVLRDFSFC